jgi:hypothetical protein
MQFANDNGITLIPVPFWWDKSSKSLAATIHSHRCDLLERVADISAAIPHKMPESHRRHIPYKANVACQYDDRVDPKGWWIMEKYDGVRVYWDGQYLLWKNSQVEVPKDLQFPSIPFEGELW